MCKVFFSFYTLIPPISTRAVLAVNSANISFSAVTNIVGALEVLSLLHSIAAACEGLEWKLILVPPVKAAMIDVNQ